MRSMLLALVTALAGCTLATGDISDNGSEEETFDEPPVDSGRPNSDPSTPPGEDAAPTPPPNEPPREKPLVEGLAIDEIAIYQAVKIPLMKGGTKPAKMNADVIVGREGMVRVFVRPEATWTAHAIVGELTLRSAKGEKKITADATPTAASTDAVLTSTVNFDIPPDTIEADTRFSVALRDASKTGPSTASSALWPITGDEALNARDTGPALKIVIVPVKYGADGSGRLPDVSAAQLELYRKAAYKTYPARKVEITARAPYDWSSTISASGSGFDSLLNAMVRLRISDKAPKDVYYYGAFAAKTSFSTYCGGGCVTGLCGLSDSPMDSSVRACVGIGFTGAETAETMIHEVGHASGRYHAPCGGPDGTDPRYPYSGAKIGSWGFDLTAKKLIDPSKTVDFMSYCNPTFVSDFNYKALTERMVSVASSPFIVEGPPETLRIVQVEGDGTLKWTDDTFVAPLPLGADRIVHVEDETGVHDTRAQFVRYDHLPGGFLILPDPGRHHLLKMNLVP
jgi:hypothetical protein